MPQNLTEPEVRAWLLSCVNIVRRNKGLPLVQYLQVSHHLRHDLGFDSLDLAELTTRIEAVFGVDVFADGIVDRWGDLVRRVEAGSRKRG